MATRKETPAKFLKHLFINKGKAPKDIAEKLNVTHANINGIMRNGSMNTRTLIKIMDACEEPLVILLSTGETVQLVSED